MADIISPVPLRPKWADRQLIAAADLTAEQRWQDAQLMRLRRLALGWGVVAGLEVSAKGDGIIIEPGYGITAAGSEVYLPDQFYWADLPKRIAKTCGDGSNPCSDPTERKVEDSPASGAWLVLVPRPVESCPRPTVPEGCAHPGSAFAYTRQGMGLIPELRCNLTDQLLRETLDCKRIKAFLENTPVPMPDIEDDILPLAWISCDEKEQVVIDMRQRRKLLPLSLLQDLITCCDCGEAVTPDPDPEPEPEPEPGPAWDKPTRSRLDQLIDQIADALPRGAEDFERSFADVFSRDSMLSFSRLNTSSSTEVLRRFAASLLVSSKVTLDHYLSGDHAALLEALAREESLSRGSELMRERLENLSLAEVFQRGKHGYALVQSQYPDVLGKELLALDGPTTLAKRFDKTDFSGIAALDWLQGRILGRWEER
jgi:hypothetical protein